MIDENVISIVRARATVLRFFFLFPSRSKSKSLIALLSTLQVLCVYLYPTTAPSGLSTVASVAVSEYANYRTDAKITVLHWRTTNKSVKRANSPFRFLYSSSGSVDTGKVARDFTFVANCIFRKRQ